MSVVWAGSASSLLWISQTCDVQTAQLFQCSTGECMWINVCDSHYCLRQLQYHSQGSDSYIVWIWLKCWQLLLYASMYIEWKQSLTHFIFTYRWHSRAVLRSSATIRIWWIPPRKQLSISGRLCRQREAITGDYMSAFSLQDQISREFLLIAGQSWMC